MKRIKEQKPKVSIIIPVYDVEPYLRPCLESVIHQTLKEIEIICINDGSTDGTLRILKEFKKSDPRIFLVDQKNRGVSSARNAGLKLARGEYIRFLDGDDQLPLDSCETLYKAANRENSDIIISAATHIPLDGSKKTMNRFPSRTYNLLISQDKYLVFSKLLSIGTLSQFFRAKTISGVQFKPYANGEDYLFYIEAVGRARTLSTLNKVCYLYLQRNNSASKRKDVEKLESFFLARKESLEVLERLENMDPIQGAIGRKILSFAAGDFKLLTNNSKNGNMDFNRIFGYWRSCYRPAILRRVQSKYFGEIIAKAIFRIDSIGIYLFSHRIFEVYLRLKRSFLQG